MLYFHNTFQGIQKFATCATKGFRILANSSRGDPQSYRFAIRYETNNNIIALNSNTY